MRSLGKNEILKLGKNWRVHNSYVPSIARYRPWLYHRHGNKFKEVTTTPTRILCSVCEISPPKDTEIAFRLIDIYDY